MMKPKAMVFPFRPIFLLLAVMLCHGWIQAQYTEIIIYGSVKDEENAKKLENVTITVLQNGVQYDVITIAGSGTYESSKLPLGYTYDLRFEKDGYVKKIVRFDTRNIPQEDYRGGFRQNCEVHLFKYIDGFNTTITDAPMGIMAFNSQTNAFAYDVDYTDNMIGKIEAELKRLDDLSENMGKLQKEFDDLILKGDQKMLEKKFGEAMDKYSSALAIFPDNAPAKAKYDDAKKKFDDEQASKDLEARYSKLLADGDKNMKAQNWDAAKRNYQDALSLKANEKVPKDKLAEIEKILSGQADQAKYDAALAEADAKFTSKDYGVAIEKYQAASALKPAESYPKTQIQKARQFLDAMLADEAERQRIEQEYADMITRGEKNLKEKSYETARQNFVEAGNLKPSEQLPKDKISDIDKILADLAAKSKANESAAAADAEAERIAREYQEHIDKANKFFEDQKYQESRAEYVSALDLKSSEKYPKTRISRIDEILADAADKGNADLEAQNRLKEDEERKKRELDKQSALDEQQRKAEEERLARIQKDQDDQAIAAAEKARKDEEDRRRREQFLTTIDSSKEDEVERYFREAKKKEEEARNKSIESQKDSVADYLARHDRDARKTGDDVEQMKRDQESFLKSKADESNEALIKSKENVDSQKDVLVRIHRQGEVLNDGSALTTQEEKAKYEKAQSETESSATVRRTDAVSRATKQKAAQQAVSQNDALRLANVTEVTTEKEEATSNQVAYASRGDALRADNTYAVKKKKTAQETGAARGEEVRQDNEKEITEQKARISAQEADVAAAAEERLVVAHINTEEQKDKASAMVESKVGMTADNEESVKDQEQKNQMFLVNKEREAAAARYDKRDELFDKNQGQPRNEDDYIARPGSESLPEGVTENSYQMGNKIVIERTVKMGNKVDLYRKVVSKTATYYFKNDQPITEHAWQAETMEISD